MANTVIQLKKSATPTSTPSDLANGELAINYADGKLFYKNATGHIVSFKSTGTTGGENFGIVNANGTLIIAGIAGDTFSILPGNNITITGDAINNRLTISALSDPTAANNWANTLYTYSLEYSNTVANSVNAYSNTIAVAANNYAGAMANAANAYAASLTPDLSPAFNKANDAYTVANAAFDKANNALPNTTGAVFNGNLNIKTDLWVGNNISHVNSAFFDTTVINTTVGLGQLSWNGTEQTLDIGLANGSILQVGQETLYRVKNQTGSTIDQGTVVMAAGVVGSSGRILITPAISDGTYPSKYLMGIATSTILNGGDGYVTHFGKVRGIDTSMFSEGDILYANVSVPGGLQNTAPVAPNTKTTVAIVTHKGVSNGELFVRPTYGSKLNEDELVEFTTLANGHILTYVSANARFENSNVLVTAYSTINAAFDVANAAYGNANAVSVSANNYAGAMANSVNAYSSATYATITNAAAAFAAANQAGVVANNANSYAGSTYVKKAGDTVSGDLVVTGNLTISGITTYANTQTLLIGDAVITLNADIPGAVAPSEDAGVEVKRGSSANVSLLWNETTDKWTFTNDGTNYRNIASNTDVENVAVSANNYAGAMANASNAYATTVGTSGNAYASVVGTSANNFAGTMANAANAYASATYATQSTVATNATSANNYAGAMANASNAYAGTVGTSANNFAGTMANASNNWANTISYIRTNTAITTVFLLMGA